VPMASVVVVVVVVVVVDFIIGDVVLASVGF